MINLEQMKRPYINDPHNITRHRIEVPMPGTNSIKKEINNHWYDQFKISYELIENKLIISNISSIETLLKHIDKISSEVEIHFIVDDCKVFNELANALSKYPTNKNIVINIMHDYYFNKNRRLDFEIIPDNVKVSNITYYNGKYDDSKYFTENSFDWWGLWLNDTDYECVRNKLTPMAKERFESFRSIAYNFYKNYFESGVELSDKEKTDFVYEWLLENTTYDGGATNQDGTLVEGERGTMAQDPIATFKNKKGVCAGRARLMKILLNNRFMKVNCYLVDGNHGKLQHQWNEVYIKNLGILYYDTSFRSINGKTTLPEIYSQITKKDIENNGDINPNEYKIVPLPNQSNITPPLPKQYLRQIPPLLRQF